MPLIYPECPARPPTSIRDLPSEVLIEIFTYLAHIDSLSPLTVASVCRPWRSIVFNAPSVWRLITLDSRSRDISALQTHALYWMTKSEPLEFDVEVNVAERDDILLLLSPFLSRLQKRWRSFSLTGPDTLGVYPLHNVGRTTKLAISVRGDGGSLASAILGIPEDDDGVKGSVNLDISQNTLGVAVNALPPISRIHPIHLTIIHICEARPEAYTKPSTLLAFLTACPNLQQFVFMGWALRRDMDEDGDSQDDHQTFVEEKLPVVYLPHLQVLRLRSTCSTRTFLSRIHTPALSELYLTYLNVDFPLPPHVDEGDEGDSEDESGDFSRSPSSDRATGMGLRKLIKRSNPPLRVLDMDCSDMRTKDFRYVFDHLHKLEEFSIVASDLSDNVIRLLAPYYESSDGGNFKLRVPRLSVLRLFDCIRVSGDAIVESLSRRVEVMAKYRDCRGSFREVSIIGCERFAHIHGLALRPQLGGAAFLYDT
ncbi:hypothetical protein EYR36_005138 [Pleurotus pulmonarius]|nr:hypothetical protein EYR36_005138 [Pleurotus pulmonarius]